MILYDFNNTQAADIKTKYLQRAAGLATTAQDAWVPVRQSVQELKVEVNIFPMYIRGFLFLSA